MLTLKHSRLFLIVTLVVSIALVGLGAFSRLQVTQASKVPAKPAAKPVQAAKAKKEVKKPWHPPHLVKTWTTTHKGYKFRITQLPRCSHVETMLTYEPCGETFAEVKRRTGAAAVLSGSFHHSQSYCLADFFQRGGRILSPARTGRVFLVVLPDGSIDLTKDYTKYKGKPGVSAMAMGQMLVPWQRDGFSLSFANKKTDRMALGLNKNHIFIVQGNANLWVLASFMKEKLPVRIAANSDGGHVIRGRAPVHVVFRWIPKGMARELLK